MILSFQRKYTIHLPCPHGTGSIRRNSTGCGVPYWRTGLFLTYINNTKFFSNGSQATVMSCVLRISVRTWSVPAANEQIKSGDGCQGGELQAGADNCENKRKLGEVSDVMEEVSKSHKTIQSLQKTVSTLEKELAASRATQGLDHNGSPVLEKPVGEDFGTRQKAYIVIGINTAFSSRKRRDSIRETWMPKGKKLAQLEQEKGIVIRFVIGRSVMPGGILDHAIETEDAQHNDFLRLDHVEGYHELSAKTKIYCATAVSKWDADFYVKVDDDVHVNPGMLTTTLSRYQSKPRIYIGCMKSGPVLAKRDAKYYEPEHWKFGEQGNKYFRHASGGIYAISQDLARYVSVNSPILHKYANEDVSLGAWFIGLDVEHIDDRNMCCGTPPDCQWKAEAGNVCAATFDWHCSGICKSVDRIKDVHKSCGEGEDAVWNTFF